MMPVACIPSLKPGMEMRMRTRMRTKTRILGHVRPATSRPSRHLCHRSTPGVKSSSQVALVQGPALEDMVKAADEPRKYRGRARSDNALPKWVVRLRVPTGSPRSRRLHQSRCVRRAAHFTIRRSQVILPRHRDPPHLECRSDPSNRRSKLDPGHRACCNRHHWAAMAATITTTCSDQDSRALDPRSSVAIFGRRVSDSYSSIARATAFTSLLTRS